MHYFYPYSVENAHFEIILILNVGYQVQVNKRK